MLEDIPEADLHVTSGNLCMSTIIPHSCELPGGIYPACEAGHWQACKVLGAGQR